MWLHAMPSFFNRLQIRILALDDLPTFGVQWLDTSPRFTIHFSNIVQQAIQKRFGETSTRWSNGCEICPGFRGASE